MRCPSTSATFVRLAGYPPPERNSLGPTRVEVLDHLAAGAAGYKVPPSTRGNDTPEGLTDPLHERT